MTVKAPSATIAYRCRTYAFDVWFGGCTNVVAFRLFGPRLHLSLVRCILAVSSPGPYHLLSSGNNL